MFFSPNLSAPGAATAQAATWADVYRGLAEVEARLNAAKDALEGVDRVDQKLRAADSYSGLRGLMGKRGHPGANNAWLKGFEMFVVFRVGGLRADGAPLRVFLNAELPGGFIGALTAHAEREDFPLAWVASSLDPASDEVALADSYGLVRRHPDRWLMGAGLPGDLRDAGQVAELVKRARDRFPGGVDLYTSDAGYSVGDDYNRQEELLARLNLGQIVAGLGALRAGGTLIVKMFTFFSPFSATLLALLARGFESLRVVKPLASRDANSEVYVVGEGYRGSADPQLAARLEQFEFAAFDVEGAESVGAALLAIARELHGTVQIQALRRVGRGQGVSQRVRRLREAAWLAAVQME